MIRKKDLLERIDYLDTMMVEELFDKTMEIALQGKNRIERS